jgi:hypothetical protein
MLLSFLLATLACMLLCKAVVVHRSRLVVSERSAFYLLAPVMSAEALRSSRQASIAAAGSIALSLAISVALLAPLYGMLVAFRPAIPAVLLGYLAIPIVYLLGEAGGALTQLAFLPSGRVVPPVHRRPYAAVSIADFWGRRWNTWLGEFFRVHIFTPLRRRPLSGLVVVFLASGLLHEVVIDLPLYLRIGRNCFGDQLAYFALQGLGVALDARIPRERRWLRRGLLWVVVVAPAPLIINEGLLRCLFLWPASAAP